MKPSWSCRQITPKKTILRATYHFVAYTGFNDIGWHVPTITCKDFEARGQPGWNEPASG